MGVVILSGPEYVIEVANPIVCQLWGRKYEAVIAKPLFEALPEIRGQGIQELLDGVVQTGNAYMGKELPVQLKREESVDTVYFNFVYEPMRGPGGRISGVMVVATDVTEQVEARQRLQEGEEQLRLMMETMPQKIFTATPNGNVDYFNPQWMEFTGLSFAQIRDWGWVQFIHPDDVDENIRRWQHSIDTGEPFELEHRFRRADGVYRWHVSRAIPMRDARGNVTMWIGSNTDIDEQKRAEEALRAAEEQKEQFIAGITHDLKTPLTTIKGSVQLLGRQARRSGTDEMARALPRLQAIDDATTRTIGMIDDLLDAARMRGGHALDLECATTDFIALTRGIAAAQKQRAGGRRIVVETDATEIIGQWDARRLDRVLENLLANACKYSPEGSVITVTLTRATDNAGTWAVLTVADRGIGIPAADLPHIFERFYRARNVQRVEGFGIGLVGVKQIVEQHGGTIAITSAESEGTTVVVRLPLTP
ncbi:MAG: PAS domain-containing sensor histidine kinase [Thermomicrobiales bacterium]